MSEQGAWSILLANGHLAGCHSGSATGRRSNNPQVAGTSMRLNIGMLPNYHRSSLCIYFYSCIAHFLAFKIWQFACHATCPSFSRSLFHRRQPPSSFLVSFIIVSSVRSQNQELEIKDRIAALPSPPLVPWYLQFNNGLYTSSKSKNQQR